VCSFLSERLFGKQIENKSRERDGEGRGSGERSGERSPNKDR
jgi:hypothetical protein